MDQHVIALFYEPREAAQALETLVDRGVKLGEISLFATVSGVDRCRLSLTPEFRAGAAREGMAGGALALDGAAVAAGAGGGSIVALGPLLRLAMGARGSGAASGDIVAALTKVGLPQPIAANFDEEVCGSGSVLVGVAALRHDDGRIGAVLRSCGATSVMATSTPVYHS